MVTRAKCAREVFYFNAQSSRPNGVAQLPIWTSFLRRSACSVYAVRRRKSPTPAAWLPSCLAQILLQNKGLIFILKQFEPKNIADYLRRR